MNPMKRSTNDYKFTQTLSHKTRILHGQCCLCIRMCFIIDEDDRGYDFGAQGKALYKEISRWKWETTSSVWHCTTTNRGEDYGRSVVPFWKLCLSHIWPQTVTKPIGASWWTGERKLGHTKPNKNNDNLDKGNNDNENVCNNNKVELIKMRWVMSWHHCKINNASIDNIKKKNRNKVKSNQLN